MCITFYLCDIRKPLNKNCWNYTVSYVDNSRYRVAAFGTRVLGILSWGFQIVSLIAITVSFGFLLHATIQINNKINGKGDGVRGMEQHELTGGLPKSYLNTRKAYKIYMIIAMVLLSLAAILEVVFVVISRLPFSILYSWLIAGPFIIVVSFLFIQSIIFWVYEQLVKCSPCFGKIFGPFTRDNDNLFKDIADYKLPQELTDIKIAHQRIKWLLFASAFINVAFCIGFLV